ncbi:hypothetical protein CKK34_2242 [Yarrowia sp. E02]|nr:hypothetical protein CKK34_2242 [Yarrowia sp. E02]
MGKADTKDTKVRHSPLHVDMSQGSGLLRETAKQKASRTTKKTDAAEEEFIDSATSRRILQMARDQQRELDEEERGQEFPEDDDVEFEDEDEEEDEEEYEEYEDVQQEFMNPEDAALYAKYFNEDEPVSLADKIMAKIREKEEEEQYERTGQAPATSQGLEGEGVMLPPKVIAVYEKVGELLSRYKSGKLPKAFKIVPTLRNWQDVLYVTDPGNWSPNAVYEGTKMFVSNQQAKEAQKFIQMVLLERFKEEIEEKKTLNYHVYRSLKKALYKPSAFFKGFLFPLAEQCTLKEAIIVSSILSKVSIPTLHSAAALMRLAEMPYSGPTSLFIKVLLDKKYALPYRVVDAVVFHFMRFAHVEEALPVIWHQSLLVFAQRYKSDITEDQRDALLDVIKVKNHPKITPEIRRELISGESRPIVDDEMEV